MTRPRVVLVTVASLVLMTGTASAATVTVCPAIGPGCTFDNVQAAVTAAAAGDTITIAAGTYLQTAGVVITKALTLDGAGPSQTIIDGNNLLSPNAVLEGQIRIDPGAGDVTVRDLAVQNPVRRSDGGVHFEIYVRNTLAASTVTVDNVDLRGTGPLGRDDGFYAEATAGETVLTNSTIGGQDFNPVLLERQTGPATVSGNTITKTSTTSGSAPFFVFSYQQPTGTFFNVTTPQRYVDNVIHAGGLSGISVVSGFQNVNNPKPGGALFTDVEISGNTIDDVGTGPAVTIDNQDASASGAQGEISAPKVTGNTLAGTGAGASLGVRIRGFVSNADVSGNTITGFGQGLTTLAGLSILGPGGAIPVGTAPHFNRIVGNGTGLAATVGSVDAKNNWWGCNAGPGAPGCDPVTGAGADFDPWLVLRATAGTSMLQPGQAVNVAADLTTNSQGAAPPGNSFPDATVIAFAATTGAVAPAAAGTAAAAAFTVFTAPGAEGAATVNSTLDSQTVPLVFDVKGGGTAAVPNTVIKRKPNRKRRPFSIIRFGSTVAGSTFFCRLDKGDFEPCTNPANYKDLDRGRHRFRVYAVGPTGLVDPSPARTRWFVKPKRTHGRRRGGPSRLNHRG